MEREQRDDREDLLRQGIAEERHTPKVAWPAAADAAANAAVMAVHDGMRKGSTPLLHAQGTGRKRAQIPAPKQRVLARNLAEEGTER